MFLFWCFLNKLLPNHPNLLCPKSHLVHGVEMINDSLTISDTNGGRSALGSSERTLSFWETLGEVAPVSVIVTDVEGVVRVWSPGAMALYGWRPDETIGRLIQEITVGPVDRRIAHEVMNEVLQGEVWEGNFHARHKSGDVVKVHVLDLPLHDADGLLCGIVGLSFSVASNQSADPILELLNFTQQMRESRLRERMQVARVLHDDIGQMLAAARSECFAITGSAVSEPLVKLIEHLDTAITHVQKQISSLLEPQIDVWEMILRCHEMTRELQDRLGVLVNCQIIGSVQNFQLVNPAAALVAYSTVRESLRNAERHSAAQCIEVSVMATADALTVTIADDGEGLDVIKFGNGLTILRDSVLQLKGQFDIQSVEDLGLTGTIVTACMPTSGGD